MAWTNVFDVGECTLVVLDLNSGLPVDPGEYASLGIDISSGPSGAITFSANSPINQYAPAVVLGFDTAMAAIRIRGAEGWPDAGGYLLDEAAGAVWLGDTEVQSAEFTVAPAGGEFSPDPLQVVEAGASSYDTVVLRVLESGGA